MSQVVALIPARLGSKGIPGKNFRMLGDRPLFAHAIACAYESGCDLVALSTDAEHPTTPYQLCREIERPAALAQDDTPMFDVVRHAVDTLGLADEDIIVLLQPTQPLRTPEHVKQAIALLRESGADSVVSVVELPLTHSPDFALSITDGRLYPFEDVTDSWDYGRDWDSIPTRRQDARQVYIRDGTVYALFVRALKGGNLYGQGRNVRPLIIPPEQSCSLDTPEDWDALVIRFEARNETRS